MSAQPATQAGGRSGPPVSFPLGRVYSTVGALRALNKMEKTSIELIARHAAGDWGDVCKEDARANESALKEGARLLSVYHVEGVKFYVITEADRSATTVLLASEY